MYTKRFLPAILSFILLISFSFNCKDKNCPDHLEYNINVSLSPQKDTFNMGDTLWLSISIPQELADVQGGIKNTFENFDFKLRIVGYRYDEFHEFSTRIFNVISQVGADTAYQFSFFDEYALETVFNGFEYNYKAFLILKESGVFAIYCGTRYNQNTNPVEISGACDRFPIYLYCITNNGENNNVELVSPYNGNSSFWEEQFRLGGGFAFVVR